jgi:hypothetical protein
MTGPAPRVVSDRTKNHAFSTYEQDASGRWKEVKHPFPCDDCHTSPALYGCIEEHGRWLRCPACHLAALSKQGA